MLLTNISLIIAQYNNKLKIIRPKMSDNLPVILLSFTCLEGDY
jgi:hypothetical protein